MLWLRLLSVMRFTPQKKKEKKKGVLSERIHCFVMAVD
jgi:hypothetical protein